MSRRRSHSQDDRRATASRSSAFKLGKKGSIGSPAPSWKPNLRRDGTYDSRPQRSVRETKPETFSKLDPEIGSRIFIHGLPKDITDEDIEDLMTNTIGPVHQCYVVYQYIGLPLYKQSSSSGAVRNPEAEVAENIRNVKSTGCAMVHFQREKDAMEAWEQYHGKILDNDKTILRVQVVIDADETWLLPAAERARSPVPIDSTQLNRGESHVMANGRGDMMAIDPPTAPRAIQPIYPQDIQASPSNTASMGQTGAAPPLSETHRPANTRTKSASKPLMQRLGPLPANNTPSSNLLSRIAVSLPKKPALNTSSSFAGRIAPLPTNLPDIPKQPIAKPANVVVRPKRGMKKGPRRVAKVAARHDAMLLADQMQTRPFQPFDQATNIRSSATDLDAEMDDYRRAGLMGLH